MGSVVVLPYHGQDKEECLELAESYAVSMAYDGCMAFSVIEEPKANNGLPQFFVEVGHPDYPTDTFGVTVKFKKRDGV